MRTAVYPGSFDPVTNVHLDIIERAVYMFDYLVASVVVNPSKDCRFGVEERVGMLREVPADLGNVRVDFFSRPDPRLLPKREVHSPGVSPLASVKDADLV
ncbi:MAG: adenylyltransferase/cytidyltransferase family protein [Thermomicrobiales bacterium]